MIPSLWKLWMSWLPNSRGWRSCDRGLSTLTQASVTYFFDRHLVRTNGLTIWTRPLDALR
jgi:hypothetical protein